MKRSIKVSLKFATAKKLRQLDHLLRRLRRLTNLYIDFLWDCGGQLDAATLNAILCQYLGYRQRADCLKYALEIVASTKASAASLGTTPSKPRLIGAFKFSSLTATVEAGKGSFDYVLKISGPIPGRRIVLPFKSHNRLNYWLERGGKILNGCIVRGIHAVLWLNVPNGDFKVDGTDLGIDLGYNKLLADSVGGFHGLRIKELCENVRRKKAGSNGKRRAQAERRDYINHTVKQLPWGQLKLIAVEHLKNLKRGKKPNRSKDFRKRLAPWTYRQALLRIGHLAEENRVTLRSVDPRNTSRECPICKSVASDNRRGEKFRCLRCGYAADADTTGARNIIARTRAYSQEPMVPVPS